MIKHDLPVSRLICLGWTLWGIETFNSTWRSGCRSEAANSKQPWKRSRGSRDYGWHLLIGIAGPAGVLLPSLDMLSICINIITIKSDTGIWRQHFHRADSGPGMALCAQGQKSQSTAPGDDGSRGASWEKHIAVAGAWGPETHRSIRKSQQTSGSQNHSMGFTAG